MNTNLNNTINILQQDNNYLQKELLKLNKLNIENNNLKIEIQELKNQQIINNFKIKYPKYNYVNIVNIITPLNVKKEDEFYSNEFEVFGLKWVIEINPKGDNKSKEDECAIFLWLDSLQYKNEKEISSIKIKWLIDSINLNNNINKESIFTEKRGWGGNNFKQSNFIPLFTKNNQKVYAIVIGMKKLDIQFKNSETELIDDLNVILID